LPWSIARVLGALSLLAVGIVHLQQYFELYSEISTIGTLFVLNFVGATVVCVGLLAPLDRLGRWAGAARTLLALAGIAQAATAFVFLFISERTPLFGFQEPGYDPPAITASRIAEVATIVFLGAFLAGRFPRRRRT
jgi:amino acid transporter